MKNFILEKYQLLLLHFSMYWCKEIKDTQSKSFLPINVSVKFMNHVNNVIIENDVIFPSSKGTNSMTINENSHNIVWYHLDPRNGRGNSYRSLHHIKWNTGCFYSMTLFQQALKGAFFKISTCDLLQIVGTEKGIFFIYDAWRYTKNYGNASDLKNSSENRKHLVLYKMYTYLQLWCFDFFGYKLS